MWLVTPFAGLQRFFFFFRASSGTYLDVLCKAFCPRPFYIRQKRWYLRYVGQMLQPASIFLPDLPEHDLTKKSLQAVGQICSTASLSHNLAQCQSLVRRAAAAGAKVSLSSSVRTCLVLFPFRFMPRYAELSCHKTLTNAAVYLFPLGPLPPGSVRLHRLVRGRDGLPRPARLLQRLRPRLAT